MSAERKPINPLVQAQMQKDFMQFVERLEKAREEQGPMHARFWFDRKNNPNYFIETMREYNERENLPVKRRQR